jgi:hypothetical protein
MKAVDYQDRLSSDLQLVFPNAEVIKEWDTAKNDPHFSSHRDVYAPRVDIAIGPFNDYFELDCGIDRTKPMRSHPFVKELTRDKRQAGLRMNRLWNSFSRCFMAVEIEFSGTSKHVLGSMINASVNGSIGILIADRANYDKIKRILNYFLRLESLERMKLTTLGNLFVYELDQFLNLLSTFSSRKINT